MGYLRYVKSRKPRRRVFQGFLGRMMKAEVNVEAHKLNHIRRN